jgi:hypothetical protein
MTPATDAEVAALAKSIAILKPEHEIDLNVGFVLSLIARIEADGERMEAARCALHKANARCTGEGKQEAIIAALDAIGWEAPDA